MAAPGSRKTLYGVPVLPGLTNLHKIEVSSPAGGADGERASGSAAGSLDELSVGSAAGGATSWSLRHRDFLPKMVKSHRFSDDEYETFGALVRRANNWLDDNIDVQLNSCETITWFTVDKSQMFTDSSLCYKSLISSRKTFYFRGLRVWYFTLGSLENADNQQRIRIAYRDVETPSRNADMTSFLENLNTTLSKNPVEGPLSKVESLYADEGVETDSCHWKRDAEESHVMVLFLRVFYITYEQTIPTIQHTPLYIRDFIPEYDQKSEHNHGYELFSVLWARAAKWIFTRPNMILQNVNSFLVKHKKGCPESEMWERCRHTEHDISKKTDYIVVIRVVYCKSEDLQVTQPKRLSYQTFSPDTLTLAAEKKSKELLFEDLSKTVDKVADWIKNKAPRSFGIESLQTRIYSSSQEKLGTEATFISNVKPKNIVKEPWLTHVRVYADGELRQES